jgi:nitronate monooxygenase
MSATLDLRRLEAPVLQAGMGSIAGHELAAAVSEAGGLGTIGGVLGAIAEELTAARKLTGAPVAVNLLLPFIRPGDAEAAAEADAIVTFWGRPRRLARSTWIHQCGSVEEAKAAEAAGVDAVIVQGVEAGGRVLGSLPAFEFLERTLAAVDVPVIAAGGIVDASGVQAALDAGATAVLSGTRFLLSDESRAHPDYKRRCLEASGTVLTELFGLGWSDAPERVIHNAATRRWLRGSDRGPGWIRAANRALTPLIKAMPENLAVRTMRRQRASWPFLGWLPPLEGGPSALVDSSPLYAGADVGAITEVRPARELVRDLTP